MKTLKYLFEFSASALLFLIVSAGCTKKFDEFNRNPIGLTDEQVNADFNLVSAFMQQAQRNIIPQDVGTYQLCENLESDVWSGYMGAEAPFVSNANNMTYSLVDGWNVTVWTNRYTNVMNPTYKVIALAADNPDFKDLDAFAKIVRVSAMLRVAEKIGPIIYTKYNQLDENNTVPYDVQEDAYQALFDDLADAITTMNSIKSNPVSPQWAKSDLAYTANQYDNWLRFANTLRLRMALRVVYVNPGLAKTLGEAALNPANGGLLEDNSQNCFISLSVTHPLNTITNDWSDIRMGAPISSFMNGYSDPRMPVLFQKAEDPNPNVIGKYIGIRSGIDIDSKSRYDAFSKLQPFPNKMQLMVAPESWFLRAEAGLRNWANAGDPQTNYEMGIKKSFEMLGVSSAYNTYVNDAVSKPAPYIDPKSITPGENDILTGSPYLSTITIKWNNSDNNDRKLERIVTQKYLALFPDGEEAWAEYRRSGYPILYPIVVNRSAGLIPTSPGVRRVPIPIPEFNTNKGAADAAAASLGGPNTGATRLFWDLEDKSFR
jgi:hypothetical protein